jgi:hypothetical protein
MKCLIGPYVIPFVSQRYWSDFILTSEHGRQSKLETKPQVSTSQGTQSVSIIKINRLTYSEK